MSEWIDRHAAAIRIWLVLSPSVIGFYPLTGLINPLWGSLSGLPLYLTAKGHPTYGPHPWTEPVAFVAGPIVMFAIRIWLSGRLIEWRSRWRLPLIVTWTLSTLVVVPFYDAPRLFPSWPVWCACE